VALLDLLLPAACGGCGRHGGLLCDECRGKLNPAAPEQDLFLLPSPGVVVGEALRLAMAAFVYEGPLQRALHRLKYVGAANLASLLADAALPALDPLLALSGPAPLQPVPVSPERLRTRGYNQAALIAARLARRRGLVQADLLVRVRDTGRQHRLDRAARLHNLRNAIGLRDGATVPAVAIVVDDILTTSATLEACAAALRTAGCREVYGFTLAREA
jgi:ComF family protein